MPLKADLDLRCNLRFDIMMANGALEEVRHLLEKNVSPDLPVMKAQGVPDLAAFLRGEVSRQEAVENAKLHTRQYASASSPGFATSWKPILPSTVVTAATPIL